MEDVHRPVHSRRQRRSEHDEGSQRGGDGIEVPTSPGTGDFDSELGLVWEKSKTKPSKQILETHFSVTDDTENASEGAVANANISPEADTANQATGLPLEELDTIIEGYKTQKNIVEEQHALIQLRKEALMQRKENERTKIISLFSNILDILADKEASLLCKLDVQYRSHEDQLEELLVAAEDAVESINTEKNVAENLKAGDRHFIDITLDDIRPLLNDIKTGVDERNAILREASVLDDMPSIEINEEAASVINGLTYVRIPHRENSDDEEHDSEGGADEYDAVEDTDSVEVIESENTESQSGSDLQSVHLESGSNTRESNVAENVDSRTVSAISTSQIDAGHPSPSAPPQPQTEEPPPPPYWQAIGLSGPDEAAGLPRSLSPVSASSDHVPHYSEVPQYLDSSSGRQQSNELIFFHNFHVKRQYDSRMPKPVALKWNKERICIADRGNSKIKVYTSSGRIIAEMYLGGCEIHDMAFLEADGDDQKYVVTIPRGKTLMFIIISTQQPSRLHYKMKLSCGYSSIAKGPSGNTLVCANALPTYGEPRIDIVNSQGNVIRSFRSTCSFVSFAYPRCIEVFDQYIIVADWKLNLVVVLHEDGDAVAQYGGTPNYPLKDPCSLTLDHFGNIMVVDGKTGNIHVIDLLCRPLEIIKCPRGHVAKLISFDLDSHQRLATYRQSGDIAVYDFKDGYHTTPQNLDSRGYGIRHMNQPDYNGVLPLVEGMLPSTIASIPVGRQRQARRFMNQPEYQGSVPVIQGIFPTILENMPVSSGRQRQANNRGSYTMFHL